MIVPSDGPTTTQPVLVDHALPDPLTRLPQAQLLDLLDDAAESDARQARPQATRTAYAEDWAMWQTFCGQLGTDPLTARHGLIYAYVKHLESRNYAPSTIERRLAGVAVGLRDRGVVLPAKGGPMDKARQEVRAYAARLRQANVQLGRGKAPALRPEQVKSICSRIPPGLHGTRMRALLLLALSIAARRSEMAGLLVGDIVDDRRGRGLDIHVRHTKGGKQRKVAVRPAADPAMCPVRAWHAWREAAGLVDGPAFCQIRGRRRPVAAPGTSITPHWVGRIIGDAGRLIDADLALTGHSVRRGMITAALEAGHDVADVCAISGHEPGSGTVYGYREEIDRWNNTANQLA